MLKVATEKFGQFFGHYQNGNNGIMLDLSNSDKKRETNYPSNFLAILSSSNPEYFHSNDWLFMKKNISEFFFLFFIPKRPVQNGFVQPLSVPTFGLFSNYQLLPIFYNLLHYDWHPQFSEISTNLWIHQHFGFCSANLDQLSNFINLFRFFIWNIITFLLLCRT